MKYWVDGSELTSKTLNAVHLGIIRKHIERRAGNMIVDPINRTSIAHTRVTLQVINPHASGWPCRDSRIAVIHPDFAPSVARGCQMHGYYECFFAGNGYGLVGEPIWGG
jgi:hypothetical protein